MSHTRSIPVTSTNPGEVLACLGLVEAYAQLTDDTDVGCWFTDEKFHVRHYLPEDPVDALLNFLSDCEVLECIPKGYEPDKQPRCTPTVVEGWPERAPELSRLGMVLRDKENQQRSLYLNHWCDGSGRDAFKLYAGNRSAGSIVEQLLSGKGKSLPGLQTLIRTHLAELSANPLGETYAIAGGLNFDPRAGWQAIDLGYSPNDQSHQLHASPLVEILATCGLQHTRPRCIDGRYTYRYATWTEELSLPLARLALADVSVYWSQVSREFVLDLSGKNKVTTFATEIAE